LEVSNSQWEFQSTRYCGDRDFPALLVEGECALVQAHTGRLELSGLGLFALLLGGFGYSRNSTNHKICLQSILFLDFLVAKVLKLNLVCSVVFLGDLEYVIAGISKPL